MPKNLTHSCYLLPQKKVREDGRLLPDFADAEEGKWLFLVWFGLVWNSIKLCWTFSVRRLLVQLEFSDCVLLLICRGTLRGSDSSAGKQSECRKEYDLYLSWFRYWLYPCSNSLPTVLESCCCHLSFVIVVLQYLFKNTHSLFIS